MNRLSFAVAASLLLAPVSAFAAYSTPADLMTAVQDEKIPRAFSLTAHSMSNGTYVSIWAGGTQQGKDVASMQMNTKATVDMVRGSMKIRAKAELIVTGGMLYVKLLSLDGAYASPFASVSAAIKQQQWISLPLDEVMLQEITGNAALPIGSSDAGAANTMFHMQSNAGANGSTVYSLSLTQDYAVTLAQMIRELLQDNSSSSDDFFPWRQLAEGMRFESTVITNAKDMFLSSSFSLSTSSTNSSLSLKGSESRLSSSLAIKAPANAISINQAFASFADLTGDLPHSGMMLPKLDNLDAESNYDPSDVESFLSEDDFDTVDEATVQESAECHDTSLTAAQFLMLQRSGVCAAKKTSTRVGW